MMLNADEVYIVSDVNGNFLGDIKQIALGVISVTEHVPPDKKMMMGYRYISPGSEMGGHTIFFSNLVNLGESVQLVDGFLTGEGKPVVWRFDPLTRDRWVAMGESIIGFDKLEKQLKTTEAVKDWYRHEFLD